jgi:hypothetical protein
MIGMALDNAPNLALLAFLVIVMAVHATYGEKK